MKTEFGMIWPEVFTKGRSENYCAKSLQADLLEMQALLLCGQKPPEKFGEGCLFIADNIGQQAVFDALKGVGDILRPSVV